MEIGFSDDGEGTSTSVFAFGEARGSAGDGGSYGIRLVAYAGSREAALAALVANAAAARADLDRTVGESGR